MKQYSVLVLYPEYISNNGETYLAHVSANSVKEAQAKAQQEAASANDDDWVDEYFVVLVTEGFIDDIKEME